MVWRLVLCLFGHLALLFFLAVYLVTSLNQVRLYTPIAHAEELELESLDTIPALLGAMDAQRRAYEKGGDPRDLALYAEMRGSVQNNLEALSAPLILPTEAEKKRRTLVRQWISEVGDAGTDEARILQGRTDAFGDASRALLDQIHTVTESVRAEMKMQQSSLQLEEASEANGRVTLMWALVGSVTFFTILIQLVLANSIIGPIQSLAGVVRRVQSGDYTARARISSGDEIQSLGETFNAMAESTEGAAGEKRAAFAAAGRIA
jgi:HAMP domain-containing protein